MAYTLVSIFLIIMAGMEWWRWYKETPPSPVFLSILAIGITIYSAVHIFLLFKTIKNLKLGRDGERVVGQLLESMREGGCKVLHDLQDWGSKNNDFNIDHIVICERGIFAIETKTYSKTVKQNSKINFTGEKIIIGSYENERLIPQANAQKIWLEKLIYKETGAQFPVKPIVVFPGWFVEGEGNKKAKQYDLWVLEPKALPKFISNQPVSISNEDKIRITNCLSNYVRREQK